MQTSRFIAVVGTLVVLAAVAGLAALFQLGTSLGGVFGGEEDPVPPQAQQDFLEVVRDGQETARDANDVQLVQARLDRDDRLCASGGADRLTAEGWWGTVRDIETGLVGDDAQLVLDLGDDVELVGTDEAPIAPGTGLYEAVAHLDDGDEVRFDGSFVDDPDGCLSETSLRLRNSLETPDFAFVLRAIERR